MGCVRRFNVVGVIITRARANNRPTESFYNGKTDLVVRNAYANGFSFGQHDLGHELGGFKNERIGSWEAPFHRFVGIV